MPPTHNKKRQKKKPIPTTVTERLTVVVTEAPGQRVPLASVCRMYRKGNKEPQLDYGAYGFKKLGSMLDAAPGLCVVVDPARCGNFDIKLFWTISHVFLAPCHPPRAVQHALLGAHACGMLMGACNPMFL